MDRAIPSLNKHLKRKEEERNRGFHLDHLRNIRPITSGDQFNQHIINNKKKQQIMENRFTQIERENRILLQKITGIMGKKRANSSQIPSQQANAIQQKSLNVTFRRKQFQEIQIQNAKLLKRLQEKKSDYEAEKMKKDWNKKKYVIRNISNYPMAIFGKDKKNINRLSQQDSRNYNRNQKEDFGNYNSINFRQNNNPPNILQMTKIKLIDGHTFSVIIRLDDQKLMIIADQQVNAIKQAKLIEISRQQALEFIVHECQNKFQRLFERLKYDGETLYLVGDDINENNNKKVIQQQDQNHQFQMNEQEVEDDNSQEDAKIDPSNAKGQNIQYNTNKIQPNFEQQYEEQNFGELIEQQKIIKELRKR